MRLPPKQHQQDDALLPKNGHVVMRFNKRFIQRYPPYEPRVRSFSSQVIIRPVADAAT